MYKLFISLALLIIPNICSAQVMIGPNAWVQGVQNIGVGTTAALERVHIQDGNVKLVNGSFIGDGSQLTGVLHKAYEGTTLRNGAFPIFKTATVSTGTAIFNLTDDGLSTGNSLFTGGVILASVNPIVSDATASYQMGWAFSNANKTLTVTTNNFTTSNILTGVLGQAAANGKTVTVQVWGYA